MKQFSQILASNTFMLFLSVNILATKFNTIWHWNKEAYVVTYGFLEQTEKDFYKVKGIINIF